VRLRSFANEDIYFYVKRIDNTRVMREADPKAGGNLLEAYRFSGCGRRASGLGPAAERLRPARGYQIQSLRQDAQRLVGEQSSLELDEARLLSPARMEELARMQAVY